MKTLSQIGEINLIRQISKILRTKDSSVLCGIGDDAAVLRFGNQKLLFKTDALLELVHFEWRSADPFLLGRKCLSVNLSDIAAMGGRPRWAVLSIALPPRESSKRVEIFFRGLQSCAKEFGVSLVGGDTDQSPDGWKITVALLGEVVRPIYRSGARVGDQIWVTGVLGASALGWEVLKRGVRGQGSGVGRKFISAHLNPVPQVKEGLILSEESIASSMIDVSDGFLLDLQHLCEASGVGARINGGTLPLASGFLEICRKMRLDPFRLALSGGEDYELLFTASSRKGKVIESVFRKLGTKVTCIGEMVGRGAGVRVFDKKGKPMKMAKKGYAHF